MVMFSGGYQAQETLCADADGNIVECGSETAQTQVAVAGTVIPIEDAIRWGLVDPEHVEDDPNLHDYAQALLEQDEANRATLGQNPPVTSPMTAANIPRRAGLISRGAAATLAMRERAAASQNSGTEPDASGQAPSPSPVNSGPQDGTGSPTTVVSGTVAEVSQSIQQVDSHQALDELETAEKAGQNRTGVLTAISNRRAQLPAE